MSLWALLGVRNWCQVGKSWRETLAWHEAYLCSGLHHVPRAEIRRLVTEIFGNMDYPMKGYVRHGFGGVARLGRKLRLPRWGHLVFSFREQLIHMRKSARS